MHFFSFCSTIRGLQILDKSFGRNNCFLDNLSLSCVISSLHINIFFMSKNLIRLFFNSLIFVYFFPLWFLLSLRLHAIYKLRNSSSIKAERQWNVTCVKFTDYICTCIPVNMNRRMKSLQKRKIFLLFQSAFIIKNDLKNRMPCGSSWNWF